MLMQAGNVNECRSRNIPLNRRYKNIRVHFKEAILSPMGPNCKYSEKHFQCCAVTQTFPHIMGSFHSHFPLSQCALYSNSQIHEYSHGRNNKHTDKLCCFIVFFFQTHNCLNSKGDAGSDGGFDISYILLHFPSCQSKLFLTETCRKCKICHEQYKELTVLGGRLNFKSDFNFTQAFL